MSRIDQLISQYCPTGVPMVRLGEVFTRLKGTPITAGAMKEIAHKNGDVRIFAGGKTIVDAFEKDIAGANIIRKPAVLVQSRGVIDFVYYEKPFTFKNEMWAYTHDNKVSVRYLYYYCKINVDYFRDAAAGMGSMPQISLPVTQDFQIPLPPLPVQEEIVRILDAMSDLVTNLDAEISARQKQYEHAREKLLRKISTTITLGEIGPVKMCKRILKEETNTQSGIPFYKIGTFGDVADAYISEETFSRYRSLYSYPNKGDILLSAAGTIGKSVVFDGNPAYFQDSNIVWISNDEKKVLNTYLYYCYQVIEWTVDNGGTVKRLYNDRLRNTTIPLPSLSVQQSIVERLDKMESLIQNLQAERALRQKQYEYYREKLLTF